MKLLNYMKEKYHEFSNSHHPAAGYQKVLTRWGASSSCASAAGVCDHSCMPSDPTTGAADTGAAKSMAAIRARRKHARVPSFWAIGQN